MDKATAYCNPEIWGGIECTINRVNDIYIDQLQLAGHYDRDEDLDAIADLGFRKMRYPVLWERHEVNEGQIIDWSWTAARLAKLEQHGIEPIAGLVHHGSGPAFTDLMDPRFAEKLASYAGQVARRFPQIRYYTPVNEPLTTARFSGLYGLWYPHKKNDRSFLRMLLNELKATVMAMREIRKWNPAAQFIQTEDLGKTYSTPLLAYQARFENERRWLTFDLLCGLVNSRHPLWNYLLKNGVSESELAYFVENRCAPDLFGFNHYLTSERYLDEDLSLYPDHTHGGNGKHRYADVEAVRVEIGTGTGLKVLLSEAWQRYRRPMAITEVHLHCHREEQLRWFRQVWSTANDLKKEGVDLRAVTSWALLGSYGWNRLLTERGGEYEPGAFDLRSGRPRPTALGHYIRELSTGNDALHPLSEDKGWWMRESRKIYKVSNHNVKLLSGNRTPIMIIGKNGTLGRAFAKICEERSIPYQLLSREDCDISKDSSIEAALARFRPWSVINTAGYVRVDDAEREREAYWRDNSLGPQLLAGICSRLGIQLIQFSSDLVFDGNRNYPYVESDGVSPLNEYGKSKAAAEEAVRRLHPDALIIRTSAFFGLWDEYNFLHYVQNSLTNYEQVKLANDQFVSPTFVPHLVHASLDLLVDKEKDIWHLANKGAITWSDLAMHTAERLGLDRSLIISLPSAEIAFPASRPKYSVLGTEKGQHLPTLEKALDFYFDHKKAASRRVA